MKLRIARQSLALRHPWKIARTRGSDFVETIILNLEHPDGIVGMGEAAPVARYHESPDTVEAFIRQVDLTRLVVGDLTGSRDYLQSVASGNMAAKSAVEMALVDLSAQLLNQAVYDFFGLGFQENIHKTSYSIGIDTVERIADKTIQAEQFPILKMKVGDPSDKENLAALREVAPQKPLRLDANEGWQTKEEALKMIEWFAAADSNIEFVEQPLPASTSVHDWKWLKKRSPLPIFGDESYHTVTDLPAAVESFHGVNVKLCKAGGLMAAKEALLAAKQAGLKTMLGCMVETSISISAAAHLAELCDFLDLDGNLLITNDPFVGVQVNDGIMSFRSCEKTSGLRVTARK